MRAGSRQAGDDPLIRVAVERGVAFFDTAEVMVRLSTKNLIAEALCAGPRHVVVATKFGWKPAPEDEMSWSLLDSRPDHTKRVVEGSLQPLKLEAIDLCYQHRVDPNVPIEDVAGAVKNLIQQGAVQALRPVGAWP